MKKRLRSLSGSVALWLSACLCNLKKLWAILRAPRLAAIGFITNAIIQTD
jgi:hypothetical protein